MASYPVPPLLGTQPGWSDYEADRSRLEGFNGEVKPSGTGSQFNAAVVLCALSGSGVRVEAATQWPSPLITPAYAEQERFLFGAETELYLSRG